MKRLLILLISIVVLLSGCSKKLTWQDVEQIYKQAEDDAAAIAGDVETIEKEDYEQLLTELDDYIEDIEFEQNDVDQEKLEKIYKIAQYIETLASFSNSNYARELVNLAINSKDLVKSIYDGDETTFNSLKTNIDSQIVDISNWADDKWSTVEKKVLVLWDNVASQLEEIETKAKDDLTSYGELTEVELEELKHTIIDNYDVIKGGVTEDTNKIAEEMYEAAIKLQYYTKKIYSDEADKVYYFAKDTQSYIKQCYGKILEDDEAFKQNFEDDIAQAKKWTQSTWNQITKELKLLEKNS